MKALIVYDSAYGNTARIADSIQNSIRRFGSVVRKTAESITPDDLKDNDVIFIGSPTQGGRPTAAIQNLINSIHTNSLHEAYIAPFDTRFATKTHGLWLRFVMKIVGFAAPKIAHKLREENIGVVAEPQGFIVDDTKGPLAREEEARASLWARAIVDIAMAYRNSRV